MSRSQIHPLTRDSVAKPSRESAIPGRHSNLEHYSMAAVATVNSDDLTPEQARQLCHGKIVFLFVVLPQCIGFALFALIILTLKSLSQTKEAMAEDLTPVLADNLEASNYSSVAKEVMELLANNITELSTAWSKALDTTNSSTLASQLSFDNSNIMAEQMIATLAEKDVTLFDYRAGPLAFNVGSQIFGSLLFNIPLSVSSFLILTSIGAIPVPEHPFEKTIFYSIMISSMILAGALFAPLANRAKTLEQTCLTPFESKAEEDAFNGPYRFAYIATKLAFTGLGQSILLGLSYLTSSAMMAIAEVQDWYARCTAMLAFMRILKPGSTNIDRKDDLVKRWLETQASDTDLPVTKLHEAIKAHAGMDDAGETEKQKKEIEHSILSKAAHPDWTFGFNNLMGMVVYGATSTLIMPSFIPVGEFMQDLMKGYFSSVSEDLGMLLSWPINVVALTAILRFVFSLAESLTAGLYGLVRTATCGITPRERKLAAQDAWPHWLGIFVFFAISYLFTTEAAKANAEIAAQSVGASPEETDALVGATAGGTAGFNMVGFVRLLIGLFMSALKCILSNVSASKLSGDTSYIAKDLLRQMKTRGRETYFNEAARMLGLPTLIFMLETIGVIALTALGWLRTGTPHEKNITGETVRTISCQVFPEDASNWLGYAEQSEVQEFDILENTTEIICPEMANQTCPGINLNDEIFYPQQTPFILSFMLLYAFSKNSNGFIKGQLTEGFLRSLLQMVPATIIVLTTNYFTAWESAGTIGAAPPAGLEGGLLTSFYGVLSLIIGTSFMFRLATCSCSKSSNYKASNRTTTMLEEIASTSADNNGGKYKGNVV